MKAKEPGAEGDGEDDEARYISLLDRVTISRELSALGDAPYWHQTSSPPPQMGEGDDGDSDFDFNPDFDEAEAHIAVCQCSCFQSQACLKPSTLHLSRC